MRVVLTNPPLDLLLKQGEITPVTSYLFYNSAPLGLLYLAAMLERRKDAAFVIDAAAEELDAAATSRRILVLRPDLIGISSTTVGFEDARALAGRLKRLLPGTPIVLGGPHVSLLPQDAMQEQAFDYGVIGEGEHAICELCEVLEGRRSVDSVLGLVYREGETCRFTPSRPEFEALDALPFPARHLLPPNLYRPVPIDHHGLPKFSMISSRGCPFTCVYCQKTRSGYRTLSPKRIVDEMEILVDDFGARDIAFVDSLFARSKQRVEALCDEILSRPGLARRVSWTCSARVGCLDKPLLMKMKQAGCWRTRFGLESGNDEVLQFIQKGITRERIRQVITWADEVGLQPKAFFMIGHLPDTHETIRDTIEFAKSIPLTDITVQINTILPRTPQEAIWKAEGEKYGRMVAEGSSDKSFWQPTFVPHGLEPEDLIEQQRRFYREFYFRPVTLWRHAKRIRRPSDVARYLEAGQLFMFLFFDRRIADAANFGRRRWRGLRSRLAGPGAA